MKYLLLLIFTLLLFGCSSKDKRVLDLSEIGQMKKDDYIDHLANVGDDYIKSEELKTIKISDKSKKFLEKIYERIVFNNQQLLNQSYQPEFNFIKQNSPFLFSLPKGKFYFSTAIMTKYLKSEELFIAAFAAEIVRSQRAIYEKRQIYPTGVYTTERLIQLTRLKAETKQRVNEWTYFVLKRAGYDSTAYLNWIQTQNRNTLDFAFYLGDLYGISREEHLFKGFITKQGIVEGDRTFNESNSSTDFYSLLQQMAR